MSKVLCIYHADCADGLLAAWVVHRALGPEVEFHAGRYGENPPGAQPAAVMSKADHAWDYPSLRGRDLIIVDFSYPLPVLRAVARHARSVLVLDHHATAREALAELDAPLRYGDWNQAAGCEGNKPSNLAAIFDMERSSAGITWDYLYPEVQVRGPHPKDNFLTRTPRPRIIDLVEDRDLWRFRYGDESCAFHAVLASYDWTDLPGMFERLDQWAWWGDCEARRNWSGDWRFGIQRWREIMDQGHAILRANAVAVRAAVAATRRTMRIAGHVVPVANVPHGMASDAGHLLCDPKFDVDYDPVVQTTRDGVPVVVPSFSATYYDGADRRHFSLLSPEGGAHVGEVARQIVEHFNKQVARFKTYAKDGWKSKYGCTSWAGGGHDHSAGFDAPLGWEGE